MSLFGSGRREGLFAVLTLLLLAIAAHAPGLFGGFRRAMDPEVTAAGTLAAESSTNRATLAPAMAAAGAVMRCGDLPLWNASVRLGEPFATSGAPLLYPPFWLLMTDSGPRGLEFLLCLHAFLACMFMYRLCRVMALSRYVAWFTGAMFGVGWSFHMNLDRLPQAAALALLPWILELTWRLVTAPERRWHSAFLAIAIFLMFSTGGTATAHLGLTLTLGLLGWRLWAVDGETRRATLHAVMLTSGIVTLLCAPLWLHWLTHLHWHAQPESANHLQLTGLLAYFSPTALGRVDAVTPSAIQLLNAGADALELALFPGTCVLFLAAVGVLRPKRTTNGLFWLAVLGVGIAFAMDSPLTHALSSNSIFASLGISWPPGIALAVAHLAICVLAGITLENFFQAPQARRFAVPTAAGLTLLLSATAFSLTFVTPDLGRQALRGLLQLTDGPEVQAVLTHLRWTLLPTILFGSAISISFLCWRRLGLLRFKVFLQVLVTAELLTIALVYTPRSAEPSDMPAPSLATDGRTALYGRTMRHRPLPAVDQGILNSVSPRMLARTHRFLAQIDPTMVEMTSKALVLPMHSVVNEELLALADVRTILAAETPCVTGFTPRVAAPLADSRRGPTLYATTGPTQRVRLVFAAEYADSTEAATRMLHHIDPRQTVVLERTEPLACQPPTGDPRIQIERESANELVLRAATAGGSGYLVIGDALAPGWQASIDGEPARILPANVAMRAVHLPADAERIVLCYRPIAATLGIPLAVFGWLALVPWLAISFIRKRS